MAWHVDKVKLWSWAASVGEYRVASGLLWFMQKGDSAPTHAEKSVDGSTQTGLSRKSQQPSFPFGA